LVRVLEGEILDSCRFTQKSSTFGKHFSVVLSAENKKQLMVPHGFARFSVLSESISDL
jgi:dTDP-4-dehydrorhamnose 3,5-epimerase